ncbi:hypothetical protein FPE53_25700 [Salmonella enterica subsp. enterica]|uniref:Fimbrial protein n=2 Tax=Salmonella enterica TaxID=28901 RepID=A0A744KEN8_SALER|nr:hypothetical protein [Salmonella enterica subsp. enterica serovar Aqua]ECH1172563.1 hypothetical protein [Salmonella enterica subsp. enterica serovar Aqua]HAF2609641.1 fimbrial protein [Salmonella enterica]
MIKAGSGTMKPRDDRPSSAQSRRLNLPDLLRWLLMVFVLAGPGHAYAVTLTCTGWDGNTETVSLALPASVSIRPGVDKFPDIPPVNVGYKCFSTNGTDANSYQAALVALSDMNTTLLQALKNIGLTLTINVTSAGVTSPPWVFKGGETPKDHVPVGPSYIGKTGTGDQTMTISAKLTKDPSANTNPGFYAIPPLVAFKLVPRYGFQEGNFFLNTPAVRIQYVPECFVQTSLDKNTVDFGPVLTSDVDNSFTRSKSFTVTASVNKDCNNKNLGNLQHGYTAHTSGGDETFYLDLPLKVSFQLNNGGRFCLGNNTSVCLYNRDTTEENGLKLEIKPEGGEPVTFNEASLPVNKFGHFLGADTIKAGTWEVRNTYYAVLSSTGKEVKTGKYSAQVTVKVDYY